MIKGFLGSLIAAAVLFAAGGISVAVLGKNDYDATDWDTAYVDLDDGGAMLINEKISGSKTWYLTDCSDVREINISAADVKTYVTSTDDDRISISVKSNDWKNIPIKVYRNDPDDGRLDIAINRNVTLFSYSFNGSGTVIIGLPNVIYDKLELELGSGTLEARDIKAKKNEFDVGSGKFEFLQSAGFTADKLELDMGSGTVKIANAAADEYEIEMGSGKFDISGLTGSGEISIGSGKGIAQFAEVGKGKNVFDLGSGSLDVYIPEDTKANLRTEIGSGSVSVDCCGVSQTCKGDSRIGLNGGDEERTLLADLGSGKVSLFNSSKYDSPEMFGDFPKKLVFTSPVEAVVDQDTIVEATFVNTDI